MWQGQDTPRYGRKSTHYRPLSGARQDYLPRALLEF